MQSSRGKIVYLLPSKMIQPQSSKDALISLHKPQQYLPLPATTSVSVRSKLISETTSSDTNASKVQVPLLSNSPSYFSNSSSNPDPLQCKGISSKLQLQSSNAPKSHPPLIRRPRSARIGSSSQDYLNVPIFPASTKPSNLSDIEHQKLREVKVLEAKISSYQNVVEKYEKLAEDATTAAIDERKAQLKILEEQLQKREQNAKNKLANAIIVMEESTTIENTVPLVTTRHEGTVQTNNFKTISSQILDGKYQN